MMETHLSASRDEQRQKARERKLLTMASNSVENSETESAKDSRGGSVESEMQDNANSAVSNKAIIPSLQDIVLSKISSSNYRSMSVENLSTDEIENKFNNLALSFKTDKLTIKERLESHRRQRNIAEKNVESEHAVLKNCINEINHVTKDQDTREKISKILHHLDIFMQSVSRLSSRSEIYGSVQQEERVCQIVDVVLSHTTNLTRQKEKAQHELLDARHMLSDSRHHINGNVVLEHGRESIAHKDYTNHRLPSSPAQVKSRRASLAALPRAMYDNVMVGLGHLFPSSRPEPPNGLINSRSRCQSANPSLNLSSKSISNVGVKSISPLAAKSNVVSRRTSLPVGPMMSTSNSSNSFDQQHYSPTTPRRRAPRLHKLSKIDSQDSLDSSEENNNKKSIKDANVMVTKKDDSIDDESGDASASASESSKISISESLASCCRSVSEAPDEDVFSSSPMANESFAADEIEMFEEQLVTNAVEEVDFFQSVCETLPLKPSYTSRLNLFSYECPQFSDNSFNIDWKLVGTYARYVVVTLLLVAAIIVLVMPFSRPIVHLYQMFVSSYVLSWTPFNSKQ